MMVQVFAFLAGVALGASIIPLARKIARMPMAELLLAAFDGKKRHAPPVAVTIDIDCPRIAEESAKVKVASV
jgi:hypothetical protein